MDSSFAANELRQFPGGLFLAPSIRTILLLDGIQPVEVSEKGWYSDQYCRKNPDKDVECREQKEGSNDSIQCPEYQRAGKPFDIQPGIHLFDWIALHQTKNALITTPTKIRNRQAPNQPMMAFWVSWSPLCHLM